MPFDANTVAQLQLTGAPPIIRVYDDPQNVVVFSLYYYALGAAFPPPSGPVISNQGAGKFKGWTPPDPIPVLRTKQVAVTVQLRPIAAAGDEKASVKAWQNDVQIDGNTGEVIVPIPAPSAAYVTKTIGVTFI
jgi:hypothetical protein